MRRNELDFTLTTMLESQQEVSDLNFTVDKPLQVESFGELVPVSLDPPIEKLTPFQTEMIALNLIGGSRRLTEELLRAGSCDSSYSLSSKARFPSTVRIARAWGSSSGPSQTSSTRPTGPSADSTTKSSVS